MRISKHIVITCLSLALLVSTSASAGQVAWWPMDVAWVTGPYCPDVINGNDAYQINGGSFGTGVNNNSWVFDGTNYLLADDDTTLDIEGEEFSIAAWFKLDTSVSIYHAHTIVDKRESAGQGPGYQLIVSGYYVIFQLWDSYYGWRNYVLNPTDEFLADGDWHHIAVTLTRSTEYPAAYRVGKIYVDGEVELTFNIANHTGSISNFSSLYIGKASNSEGQTFVGELDDLRMFDHALTYTEVQSLI